jgi:hypothetical protein
MHLGLPYLINEMNTIDGLWSGVLVAMLLLPDGSDPNLSDVGVKEQIFTVHLDLVAEEAGSPWWNNLTAGKIVPGDFGNNDEWLQGLQEERGGFEVRAGRNRRNDCKLNVDASFLVETCTGGATCAVIWDDRGLFVACSNCGIPSISDAATAEARALRDGLLLASQAGCTKLIVKSDCIDVISTMLDA